MRYHDKMSDAEMKALLDKERILDEAYDSTYAAWHWLHELADAIWLRVEWEQAGADFMAPRDEWDTEQARCYFIADHMLDEMYELRRAALDHRGRP